MHAAPNQKAALARKESRVLERRKLQIQLPIRVPLQTIDTANANVSASTNTVTNTADMSVSTSTRAPTSETSEEKDAKIHQRKATLLAIGHFRVFSPLIFFLFHLVIDINNSTRITVFNPIDNNQRTLSSLPCEN